MNVLFAQTDRRVLQRRPASLARGFTTIELVVTLAVGLILSAVAAPMLNSTVQTYRLRAAISNVSGAIQSARYNAIYQGYPYQLKFSKDSSQIQLANEPPGATTFSNVGSAIPLGASSVAIDQDVTLQFKANGSVQATAGSTTFTLTYNGKSETITVSTYGNITVYP